MIEKLINSIKQHPYMSGITIGILSLAFGTQFEIPFFIIMGWGLTVMFSVVAFEKE